MTKLADNRQALLEDIRLRYEQGKLSREEAMDSLGKEMAKELQNPYEALDDDWLDVCQQMMDVLGPQQNGLWPDHRQQNWEAIEAGMRRYRLRRRGWRIALAAACILLAAACWLWR